MLTALRNEILTEAVEGRKAVPEWVALQTTRLYRYYTRKGFSHNDALAAAQREMMTIMDEALEIRKRRKDQLKTDIAAWCVIVLGVLACIGWWLLWV
jgi:hypothetical protein